MKAWIGVDLDGTLAFYDGWKGPEHIGPPVVAMVDRVRNWLKQDRDVRIFTARICDPDEALLALPAIQQWSLKYIGVPLPVTNVKDHGMVELWDDRVVQVEKNTGRPIGYSTGGVEAP